MIAGQSVHSSHLFLPRRVNHNQLAEIVAAQNNSWKETVVFHFGTPSLDKLLLKDIIWEEQQFVDTYLDTKDYQLTSKGFWLKKRRINNQEFFSLKIQIEEPSQEPDADFDQSNELQEIQLEEITKISQIEQFLQSQSITLTECQPYAEIPFTRWTITLSNTCLLHVDSCELDSSNFYLMCAVQGNSRDKVCKALVEDDIMPIVPHVLDPVPSKIVSWIQRYNSPLFDLLASKYRSIRSVYYHFEDRILVYHRWSDPFDAIRMLGCSEDFAKWMKDNNLHTQYVMQYTVRELYESTPQELLQKIPAQPDCALIYHKLHHWEAGFIHDFEELKRLVLTWNSEDAITIRKQVDKLKAYELRMLLDGHLLQANEVAFRIVVEHDALLQDWVCRVNQTERENLQ